MEIDEIRNDILNALQRTLQSPLGQNFMASLQKNMESKHKVTRQRALQAYQRLMELLDILKYYKLYEMEEGESQTFNTIKRMFEHFSNKRAKSFNIMLGLKKWVLGLRYPIAYSICVKRYANNNFTVEFKIGFFYDRHTLD